MGIKLRKELEGTPESLAKILLENEEYISAYRTKRDFLAFTSKRLVFVDRKGLTGKKANINSIPYSKITSFTTENERGAGTQLLKINFFKKKVNLKVSKKIDIYKINKILATFVCK